MERPSYYNEFDPYAAQWLRNLIAKGLIAPGDVDERSITDVRSDDLRGYVQCHFFAGIGVWSHALRLAGWPDDRPVWTGSCPCQPFSAAGKQKGVEDERHLWPYFFRLIAECRPPVVFGEQVESAIGHGWLDVVSADLENADYAVGAVGIPAAGVGAPHIRQRLYWVADAAGFRQQGERRPAGKEELGASERGTSGGLGNTERFLPGRNSGAGISSERGGSVRAICDAAGPSGSVCRMADSAQLGCGEERPNSGGGAIGDRAQGIAAGLGAGGGHQRPGPTNGFWRDADWLFCRDGRWRPVEPGTFPLASGAASRVGRLRAYGNAIVPQVAQAFIEAFLECQP